MNVELQKAGKRHKVYNKDNLCSFCGKKCKEIMRNIPDDDVDEVLLLILLLCGEDECCGILSILRDLCIGE